MTCEYTHEKNLTPASYTLVHGRQLDSRCPQPISHMAIYIPMNQLLANKGISNIE